MTRTIKLFNIGLRQIRKDGMLFVLLLAPFIMGFAFKLGIPFANSLLENNIDFSLQPWYGLVDGFIIALSPMFTAMIVSFLMLEERDEGISMFYQITPIEGYSYLFSRIGMPMIWAFLSTIGTAILFSVSSITIPMIFAMTIISTIMAISLAMMVVSLAGNKVEGLALSKLMGFSILGLPISMFAPVPYKYLCSFLPSFWVGQLMTNDSPFMSFIAGCTISLLWMVFFTKRFLKK